VRLATTTATTAATAAAATATTAALLERELHLGEPGPCRIFSAGPVFEPTAGGPAVGALPLALR
jgi:hypothetical protein